VCTHLGDRLTFVGKLLAALRADHLMETDQCRTATEFPQRRSANASHVVDTIPKRTAAVAVMLFTKCLESTGCLLGSAEKIQLLLCILASLNHPNIASIYGLEESRRFQALVYPKRSQATTGHAVAARSWASSFGSIINVVPE
jgi:hypothetical protein